MPPERFLIPADGPQEEPVAQGLALTDKLCARHSADAVLLVPTQRNVEGTSLGSVLGEGVVRALLGNRTVKLPSGHTLCLQTERTFRHSHDRNVILAVYATDRMLCLIDDARDAPAVIVVPWTMESVRNWQRTWNPSVSGRAKQEPEQLIGSPLLEFALKSLTGAVNLSTGLVHPRDRAAAVDLFRLLFRDGERWDPDAVRAWALRNGWTARGADDLREVAEGVLQGRRLQGGNPMSWRPDIIEYFRQELREPAGSTPPS
jgi:hypothetical protein